MSTHCLGGENPRAKEMASMQQGMLRLCAGILGPSVESVGLSPTSVDKHEATRETSWAALLTYF